MSKTNLLDALNSHENPRLVIKLAREVNQLKSKGSDTDAISLINYCRKKGYNIPLDMSGFMEFFYLVSEIALKIRKC